MQNIDEVKQYVLDNGMADLIDSRLDRYEPTSELIDMCRFDDNTHAYEQAFYIIDFYCNYLKENQTYVHKFIGYKGVKEFKLYMRFRLEHIKKIMSDVSYNLDDYTFYGHSFTNAIPSFTGNRISLVYNDNYDDINEHYHLDIDEQLFLYGSDEAIKKLVYDTIIKLKTEESKREARNIIDSYIYNRYIYKAIESYINDNSNIDSYRDNEGLIDLVSGMVKNK